MRILFIQRRYHTNRHPIIKALKSNGHNVKYMSLSEWEIETHDVLSPNIIGLSPIFRMLSREFEFMDQNKYAYGWPPLRQLWNEMRSYKPDVVIVRNWTMTSAISILYTNIICANLILQEQWPKYVESVSLKKKAIHRVHKFIFNRPFIRTTPIEGNKQEGETLPDVYYLPFTVDLDMYDNINNKECFLNDDINIISVGKLGSRRKNHLMLLKTVKKLWENYNLHLTIVGGIENENDAYYQQICKYINDNNLTEIVDIRVNLEYNELQQEYANHDLYVLPSRKEPAAVSPLEAMAAGVPAICSDSNGTKGYIVEGETGYVFRTGSQKDLTQKIERAINDREQLKQMGENAWHHVRENHHPQEYAEKFEQLVKDRFGVNSTE